MGRRGRSARMPGWKCEASRLPEGRSRKQARQELEEDDEEPRGRRSNEQRREGTRRSSCLYRRDRIASGYGRRWQAMGCGARVAISCVAMAMCCRRGAGRQESECGAPDSLFPDKGVARRNAAGRAVGCPSRVCMGCRLRRGTLRWWGCRRGGRPICARRRICSCRCESFGDDLRRLGLDRCGTPRGGPGGAGHGRRDERRGRSDLLRDHLLRISRGGVRLLEQLLRTTGVLGAR
jgi:hypothetical protein